MDEDTMDRLWTYEDLAKRWGVCGRQARRICGRLRLKPLRLGHRTARFRPVAVVAAEERAERGPRRTGWLG